MDAKTIFDARRATLGEILVQVGVHYESDLEFVERVTIEVANETLREVTGGVKDFKAFTRYHTFADFSDEKSRYRRNTGKGIDAGSRTC